MRTSLGSPRSFRQLSGVGQFLVFPYQHILTHRFCYYPNSHSCHLPAQGWMDGRSNLPSVQEDVKASSSKPDLCSDAL